MKIASHNSWTYAKPLRWWMYLFQPLSRCQSLTIQKQLKEGVRHFDLRIKIHKGIAYVAHGLVRYDITAEHLMRTLNRIGNESYPDNNTSVRILLENRRPTEGDIRIFQKVCCGIEETMYGHRKIRGMVLYGGHGAHGGCWYHDYHHFQQGECAMPVIEEFHASVQGGLIPYLFARKHNSALRKLMRENDILMIDFVEL